MAIQFRDVAYGLPFLIQMTMYISPIIYPVRLIPDRFLPVFGLNPMVGVVAGLRAAVENGPIPWGLLLQAGVIATLLAVFGVYYFRKAERVFADVA
jgi:lipopolysaccharide transport system permease protein